MVLLPLTAPQAESSTSASTIAPIPVTDILTQADEDQQRIDRAKRLMEAPSPVEHLSALLDGIARPVYNKLHASDTSALRKLPIMRLESLDRNWKFDARRLEQWETQARHAFQPYSDNALLLAQRNNIWAITRVTGSLSVLPPGLSERLDNMLVQLDMAESGLGNAIAEQFALTQRASQLKAEIQAGSDQVTAAIEDLDRRLLQTDVFPLWQDLGPTIDLQAALAAMSRGLDIEEQFAIDYQAARTRNHQALWLIQLLLLPLILWLRLRGRHSLAEDGAPSRLPRALRRPFSTWLLLSMLAAMLLEPNAPLLAQEFALLVALIPVLRLLPSGTVQALGAWPYVAVVMYGLDRLGVAAMGDGGIYRLYLLTINGLALGLTLWLLRGTTRRLQNQDNYVRRAIRPIGWTALALLFTALCANLFGNVSLAEALTSGVIDSGYMALLLYASMAACLGLFRVVLAQPELANRHFIRQQETALHAGFSRLLVFGAACIWFLYSVDQFRLLRPLYSVATTVMGLGIDVGEVSINLGNLVVFVLSAWLALWAARVVRKVLRAELPNHSRLPRGVGNSIASLSYYGVFLLGLLIALSAAGFKVSQLALIFGALGVGIGFGLQNVVSNFVSGLVLMFERPIQPGDAVDAAGVSGTVREIGLRATTLRTFDGADVVIPNGLLLSGNLTNWTMYDQSRRIEIPIGVAYGSDPSQVRAVLDQALREVRGVAESPAPVVVMTGYGDSALNFSVRAWTHDSSSWVGLRSEILTHMLAALQRSGISIPYQQVDVNLRNVQE